jgi:activator of HSP90 ATPase
MQPMEHLLRRQFTLIFGGSLAAVAARAQTQTRGTTIHNEVDYKVPPARIYEVLLDAKQFAALTKDTAEIQPQAGAAFKLFGGRIEGRNIELVPNQRIVQAWRPADWPAGVYSIVKFELVARSAGTRIVFDHAGFTADKWEGLNWGWQNHYWEPLHKYLNA